MESNLKKLLDLAERAFSEAKSLEALALEETRFLGRKGELTTLLRGVGALPLEERKRLGALSNSTKLVLEKLLTEARERLSASERARLAETEWLDTSAPGTIRPQGHIHLVTRAIREIERIFAEIGFGRVAHREVDWDWYAFGSLNMPDDHPARDEWETFFVGPEEGAHLVHPKFGKMVLTPHTSNAQVREMEKGRLPIRMINIAKCYRRQSDPTHSPMFHQFEGLYVDRQVTIRHLKGVLDHFAQSYFGVERKTRLRPFHFQFTEPSFEVDISCGRCAGSGWRGTLKCPLCKRGWLELGGAGMTHPNVLKAGGIDPEKYGAFAFGWGVERTLMMKAGLEIPDIRLLYQNDLRFLQQF